MRKIFIPVLTLLIAAAVSSCSGNEQSPQKPVTVDTASAGDQVTASATAGGQAIFESKCTVCHGSDGRKGVMGAADLSTSTVSHEGAVLIIKNGKNAMTPFGGQLTGAEIDAVARYVESLRR